MKTEDLIVGLASEAGPVHPVASVGRRLGSWAAGTVVVCLGLASALGPREDFAAKLADPGFIATTIVILALAATSALAVLSLSVPNDARRGAVRAWPMVAVVGWGLLLATRLVAVGPVIAQLLTEPVHAACLLQITAAAVLPAAWLVVLARRAAPLESAWVGVFAAAAGLGVGAVTSAIVCPIDSAAHQVWWHFLPVVTLTAVGVVVGRVWLDRFRPRASS